MDLALRVFNTRTHRLEPLVPRAPGLVRMYVCGPSVYDDAHLGHARSYVAYDAIKRVLRAVGLRVLHVQNFTDVEENIARRAAEAGLEPLAYAGRYIDRFFEDMDCLRVLRADHYPRVSESIGDIVRLVQALQEQGFAYVVDCAPRPHASGPACDVYFDVERVRDFGQLVGETLDDLTVDRPLVAGDRRHPLDFALWKAKDDWGVTWPSPWGEGRPGWHVECAAMAIRHLGPDFDLHGGGLDLVFPHHESERVIGEAWTGRPYCNHYLHNGFVTVGSRKMSKSLGNFVTVRKMLDRHDAEAVRTFLLTAHYRAPLDYDPDAMRATEARLARWRSRVAALREEAADAEAPTKAPAAVAAARDAFWAAVANDFQFHEALAAVDRVTAEGATRGAHEAAAALAFLREAAGALGILWTLGEK